MMNWRPIPFIRLLLPLVIGIIAATYVDYFATWFYIIPILLLAATIIIPKRFRGNWNKRWIFGVGLSLLIFSLGYMRTWHNDERRCNHHFSKALQDTSLIYGVVQNIPVVKNKVKVQFEIVGIGEAATCGNMICYLEKDSTLDLQYGDLIVFQSRVSGIDGVKNPKAFDYQSYLANKNIYYQAFPKAGQWQRLDQSRGNLIYSMAFGLRLRFLNMLRKYLDDDNSLSVASALILGYKDELSQDVKSAYSDTGAMHVLAVSGLHVGLLFILLRLFFGRIPFFKRHKNRWYKVGLFVFIIWAFAFVTGASASVLRAATMFTFIIYGTNIGRYNNIYQTIAISAMLLLLINPYYIFDVGFQLSYFAMLSIIYFHPKIFESIFFETKWKRYIWNLLAVALAAQIVSIPISLYYFHKFPTYFLLSGLIVVPAASAILSIGILLFVMESISPVLGNLVAYLLDAIIWIVNQAIFLLQNLPSSIIDDINFPAISVVFSFLAIGFIILAMETRKLKNLIIGSACLLLVSINFAFQKSTAFSNKELVVYHVNNATLIDCLIGNTAYSISSKDLEEKSANYAAKNYRTYKNIQNQINLSSTDTLSNLPFFYQKGFLAFGNKKLAIVDNKIPAHSAKIKVDYLLLTNGARVSIQDLSKNYTFGKIIFDASNPYWLIKKWVDECETLELDFYDIRNKGAFVISLD